MQLEEKALLLRIFIGENDRFGQHPFMSRSFSKRGRTGSPERLSCADQWGLDTPADYIPPKSCVCPKIFPSLSKSSTASRKSRLFSRWWTRW